LGNLRGGSFIRDTERWMKGTLRGTASLSLSLRELCNGEPGGGAPLLGTPEGVYRKALEIGLFLYRGPAGGP